MNEYESPPGPGVVERLKNSLSEAASALNGTTEDHKRAALNLMSSDQRELMIQNMKQLIEIANQFEGK